MSANQREAICSHVVRILKEERERQKFSMTRLAEKAGLSQSMVSLVERDLRNPTLDTLLRISEALDIDFTKVIQRAAKDARFRSWSGS